MIYPHNIEQKIDFQVIRDGLKSFCTSPLGRERVDEMQWMNDFVSVNNRLVHLREMINVLADSSLSFPLGDIYDLREALSRIRIEGLFMDESELFSLRKMLDYVGNLERFLRYWTKKNIPY
jgi:DNA mismatch repair protein MutS2